MELLDVVAVEGRVRRGGDLINHVGDVGEQDGGGVRATEEDRDW